ncbi:MAG: hypothetical protein SGJ09_12900 [Phycisphaerae bacterium]|nr:hypothetical protein [Phycisphaerae bacterium]
MTLASASGYEISEFTDINALGWILGNAFIEGIEPYYRPVVLIPDPCAADLNLDGAFNSTDQGILLGTWGACGGSGYCAGDLDRSGSVGSADLSILLGAWGSCDDVDAIALAFAGQPHASKRA